ncbi:hypothetical protein HMPREF9554_02653 [Treponema phagedenis F0421]|nr:hypothetical protein HMPREF9554_02653 [Treponema phagedenis F0421]
MNPAFRRSKEKMAKLRPCCAPQSSRSCKIYSLMLRIEGFGSP